MQLTHIALWTNHLERLRDFYVKYFNGKSNEKYVNSKKGFASYFVSFGNGDVGFLSGFSYNLLDFMNETCAM